MEKSWPNAGAALLQHAESAVLMAIGAVLALLALCLLGTSCVSLFHALVAGKVAHESIEILNGVLLVMMTMEIVYTVTISLRSHTLVAEPFLIIGSIAAIRRMLVITATSTDSAVGHEQMHDTLVELGLLAGTVLVLAVSIYVLRRAGAVQMHSAPGTASAGRPGPPERAAPSTHAPVEEATAPAGDAAR